MRIGELSNASGVSVATIRLYEREGLIGPAERTEGQTRIFSERQMRRLIFIKRVRNLGFTLDDVKALLCLSEATDPDRSALIARIRSGVTGRRNDLAKLDGRLRSILEGERPADGFEDMF